MDERQSLALSRLLEQDREVQRMVIQEPTLRHIMTIAAKQTHGRDRWFAYSALKSICYELVGWRAYNPALRNCAYWEKMMDALDELLPDIAEGDDEICDDSISELEQTLYQTQAALRRKMGKA